MRVMAALLLVPTVQMSHWRPPLRHPVFSTSSTLTPLGLPLTFFWQRAAVMTVIYSLLSLLLLCTELGRSKKVCRQNYYHQCWVTNDLSHTSTILKIVHGHAFFKYNFFLLLYRRLGTTRWHWPALTTHHLANNLNDLCLLHAYTDAAPQQQCELFCNSFLTMHAYWIVLCTSLVSFFSFACWRGI